MEIKIIKETKNLLFPRTEVIAEVEENVVPTKEEVLEALSVNYKVDKESIKVMTIKGKFGLKVFEIIAHVYSSVDDKDRIEVKTKQEKEAEEKVKEEAKKAAEEEKKAKEAEEAAKKEAEEKAKESETVENTPTEDTKEEAKE